MNEELLEFYKGRIGLIETDIFSLIKYAYDGNHRVEYICRHLDPEASDDNTKWRVTKYTYDASSMVTVTKTLTGSWTTKAGL